MHRLLIVVSMVGCNAPDLTPTTTTTTTTTTTATEGTLVELETTVGPIVIDLHEEWAPLGAARFLELVDSGFYDDTRFFRVVPEFVVQFGLSGDPAVNAKWRAAPILDDPVVASNTRRMVTFATAGPDTRTTQLFINLGDNSFLDDQGFAPIGRVVEGMANVRAINDEYGERPDQGQIQASGNAYLDAEFPDLDGIERASVRGVAQ